MLTREQRDVLILHIRNGMMNKVTDVKYATQKAFYLREDLIKIGFQLREDSVLMSPILNCQYRLGKSIAWDEEYEKARTHEKKLRELIQEQYQQTELLQQELSHQSSEILHSADVLLFTLLKAQHYQWRDRLYLAALAGELEENITDEYNCPLGKWLCSEGMRRFMMLSGFRELSNCHHELHQAASRLVGQAWSSILPVQLEAWLQHIDDASQKLICTLDQLEMRVELLYPTQRRHHKNRAVGNHNELDG